MRKEFAVHLLNEVGQEKAKALAGLFEELLDTVEELTGAEGREIALVRTKLEEACFYAKKALASRNEHQQ